jgi:acyl-coenzyme A thioesterase PaaI-like protein
MSASLDQARAVLAAQPFSRLLGARLNTFGLDGIDLEVPVRPAHRQQQGFALAGCSAMPPTTPSPSPLGRSSAPGC